MKFAQTLLKEDEQPELHALYKQLKKQLKIFDEKAAADAGSKVAPSSSDDEEAVGGSGGDITLPDVAMGPEPTADAPDSLALPAAARQQQRAAGQLPAAAALAGAGQQQEHSQAEQAGVSVPAAAAGSGVDPGQESRFVALLEQCVQQLNEDYISREEMLVIKADLAETAAVAATTHEQLLAAYQSVVDLHGELVLLCHWSMCAYTGIVKILKKHHKRTGGQRVRSELLANLLSQPFCSLEEVRGMVRVAEQHIAVLADKLGLAPSLKPTVGGAAAAAVRDTDRQPLQALQPLAAGVAGAAAQQEQQAAGEGVQPTPVAAAPMQVQEQEQEQEQEQGGSPGEGYSGSGAVQQAPPVLPAAAAAVVAGAVAGAAGDEPAADAAMQTSSGPASGAPPASDSVGQQRQQQHERQGLPEQQQRQGQGQKGSAPSSLLGRQQAAAAAGAVEVAVVAASGRAPLKRDRSKQYAPAAKRRESLPREDEPQSSGSSMQVSVGGGSEAAQQGQAQGGDVSSAAPRRTSILQRTRAALQLWKVLRSTAATPSTVLGEHAGVAAAAAAAATPTSSPH